MALVTVETIESRKTRGTHFFSESVSSDCAEVEMLRRAYKMFEDKFKREITVGMTTRKDILKWEARQDWMDFMWEYGDEVLGYERVLCQYNLMNSIQWLKTVKFDS